MTLSFSTHWPKHMGEWAGQPNYFPEKIIAGLDLSIIRKCTLNDLLAEVVNPTDAEFMNGSTNPNYGHKPKLHTIRHDPHGRWKAGMKIHPVINNRTKNRFQFSPVIKCVSVQSIEITKSKLLEYGYAAKIPLVYIDDVLLESDDLEKLAINDGFPTLKAFFAYFNEDFQGKIIHWTDLKY